MITFEEAVASLRKSGAKSEKDLVINNVTITEKENWTRVALTLNREVDGPVLDEDNWTMGKTCVVYLSLYSIVNFLKNVEDTAAIASHIVHHPTSLQIILNGGKVEILQQEVKAQATYIDVFTNEELEYECDHDSLFNHLVSIEFTDKGRKGIEKIENMLLGL